MTWNERGRQDSGGTIMIQSEFPVSMLGLSNGCVAFLCLPGFLEDKWSAWSGWICVLPAFSFLASPFMFHCLPYSSFIAEIPEYQIIAKSSANVNRFFCLLWNYANFWQLKMYFFSSPDLFHNPISYLQIIPQLIF